MDWFPWYFDLYQQDTMHLDPYQDGCYRRLIDHYMKTRAALPDSDAALARIVGDSQANWVAMASAIVRPFFTPRDGRLYLKRCEDTLRFQDTRTKKLSESGKNGAKKRWNEINNIDSQAIATPMGPAIAQDRKEQEKKKEKPRKPLFEIPAWIDPQDWIDYSVMRKKIKKPMTEAAMTQAIKKLETFRAAGHDPKTILQQSTFQSWQGLFAPKENHHEKNLNRHERLERASAKSLAEFTAELDLGTKNTAVLPDPEFTETEL